MTIQEKAEWICGNIDALNYPHSLDELYVELMANKLGHEVGLHFHGHRHKVSCDIVGFEVRVFEDGKTLNYSKLRFLWATYLMEIEKTTSVSIYELQVRQTLQYDAQYITRPEINGDSITFMFHSDKSNDDLFRLLLFCAGKEYDYRAASNCLQAANKSYRPWDFEYTEFPCFPEGTLVKRFKNGKVILKTSNVQAFANRLGRVCEIVNMLRVVPRNGGLDWYDYKPRYESLALEAING